MSICTLFHVAAERNKRGEDVSFNFSLCLLPQHKKTPYIRINFLIVIFYNNLCITIFRKRCLQHSACALAARCH